jgi:hypothetical protein
MKSDSPPKRMHATRNSAPSIKLNRADPLRALLRPVGWGRLIVQPVV